MRFRQIHLDFHTSEQIPGVGAAFSSEQFQDMLRLGRVDSITLFSKCHHGWSYHPTSVGRQHPTLGFDLLGAQIEAAHAIGVRTPVYLSAGLDEQVYRTRSCPVAAQWIWPNPQPCANVPPCYLRAFQLNWKIRELKL